MSVLPTIVSKFVWSRENRSVSAWELYVPIIFARDPLLSLTRYSFY